MDDQLRQFGWLRRSCVASSSLFLIGMLIISLKQISQFRVVALTQTTAEVARCIRETHPSAGLSTTAGQIQEMARQWVTQCSSWQIESAALMCQLFRFRVRWGVFEDEESAWILAVLNGEMAEDDKLDYLNDVFYGG